MAVVMEDIDKIHTNTINTTKTEDKINTGKGKIIIIKMGKIKIINHAKEAIIKTTIIIEEEEGINIISIISNK